MVEHGAYQRLLGREVVVEGGDVDPDRGRHLAGPQAFETALRDLVIRGQHQLLPSLLTDRWPRCLHGLIKHLMEKGTGARGQLQSRARCVAGTVSPASISTTLCTSPVSRSTRSCRSALVPSARIVCTYSTALREPRSSTTSSTNSRSSSASSRMGT